MARKSRLEVEPGIHHVYARGNERRRIFQDDVDRHRYLSRLARTVDRQRWRLLAYCLMPNHVHLLIETAQPNLGAGMQWLHGGYAQRFNARHDRSGHLFQGRFGSVTVTDDGQFWLTAAYIAINPVAAGLCEEPGQWPWSSHAAVLAASVPAWLDGGRLLELFGALGGEPRERYAELVQDRLAIV